MTEKDFAYEFFGKGYSVAELAQIALDETGNGGRLAVYAKRYLNSLADLREYLRGMEEVFK